jgi:hypothetical protein
MQPSLRLPCRERRGGIHDHRKDQTGARGSNPCLREKIEDAVAGAPFVLAPLKLHYLRWVLFNIGSDTYFMYQGIFDTDFDKYTEDAITLFKQTGVDTVFENLEGFPMDWKTNAPAFVKFVREPSMPKLSRIW